MSNIIVIESVLKEKEPYEGSYEGKPYTSYEWVVAGTVDGAAKDRITIKTSKENNRKLVAAGACFEAEFKDNKGFKSYKLIAPIDPSLVGAKAPTAKGGGFSGNSTNISIEKQTSLKAAVDLHKGDPAIGIDEVVATAQAFYDWLSGAKKEKPQDFED